MSKILNSLNFFLDSKFNKLGSSSGGNSDWVNDIVSTMRDIVNKIIWPAIAIILTLGIVYVIILGVNYAKAETSDKKEEAKKRIINAVVGVVIMLALIAILNVFLNSLDKGEVAGWVDNVTGNTP